jgi:hypothetical protein
VAKHATTRVRRQRGTDPIRNDLQRQQPPRIRQEETKDVSTTWPATKENKLSKQTSFLESFYQRYLEKNQDKILRLWEGLTRKPDRGGIGFNEAEAIKNEARNDLLKQLFELDPGYKQHHASMIGWSLFRIQGEINTVREWQGILRMREEAEDEDLLKEWQQETQEWLAECDQKEAETKLSNELGTEQKSKIRWASFQN